MKRVIIGLTVLLVIIAMTSCKKNSTTSAAVLSARQLAIIQTKAIPVEPSPVTTGDSIYLINTHGVEDTAIAFGFASLPSKINVYLSANYTGYTPMVAYKTEDSISKIVNGYVAIFRFTTFPIGIKFDTSGTIINVLEQREGNDLLGTGWHTGGYFDGRDNLHRDTFALSALPTAVKTYFTSFYSQDSLENIILKRDGEFVVISEDNGIFATTFNSTGTFLNREQIQTEEGVFNIINSGTLPAIINNYITTIYPGYFFDRAYTFTIAGIIQGYCVMIDSNNSKYAMQFDATGNFITFKIIN